MVKTSENPERKIYRKVIDARFYNYFDVCRMEGITEMRAKNAIKLLGVEGIKNIPELKPIEHLFVVFENPRKGSMRNSYGILRRYYDEWKQLGRVKYLTTAKRRPAQDNMAKINVEIMKTLKDELTDLIDRANAISVQKTNYTEAVSIAIREYIDRRKFLV